MFVVCDMCNVWCCEWLCDLFMVVVTVMFVCVCLFGTCFGCGSCCVCIGVCDCALVYCEHVGLHFADTYWCIWVCMLCWCCDIIGCGGLLTCCVYVSMNEHVMNIIQYDVIVYIYDMLCVMNYCCVVLLWEQLCC